MAICFEAAEALPEGGVKFFLTFTRFEFALKDRRYLPAADGDATANWDRFSGELGPQFFNEMRDSGRAPTLMGPLPPRKQICANGSLDWRDMPRVVNTRDLFVAIRRVRNNLVHGGKSGDPERDGNDPNRSRNLIAEAQWVLEQALENDDGLKAAFEGRY